MNNGKLIQDDFGASENDFENNDDTSEVINDEFTHTVEKFAKI